MNKDKISIICHWKMDISGDYWETECGSVFSFFDGGPKDNHFGYCPYCGKNLEETPCEGDDDEQA